MKKQILSAAILASLGVLAPIAAQAAAVNNGDQLTINAATFDNSGYVTGGSYFMMDTNGNNIFTKSERTGIEMGTQGIIIGVAQSTGASHSGTPFGGNAEGGTIDAAWNFFGNTGMHFTVSPITGDTTSGLNLSGWRVTWSGIPSINMGGGLQNCGTTSDGICVKPPSQGSVDVGGTYNNGTGMATFTWDGVYGHAYTLSYRATVPQADASGFGGVKYGLELTGTVQAVPVPAAVWLFGSGLLGLVGVARRKKKA